MLAEHSRIRLVVKVDDLALDRIFHKRPTRFHDESLHLPKQCSIQAARNWMLLQGLRMKYRERKRKEASKPFPTRFLLFIAVGASLYFLITRRPEPYSTEVLPSSPSETKTTVTKTPVENATDNLVTETAVTSLRAKTAESFEHGLQSLLPDRFENRLRFTIEFRPEKQWCIPGDLDTIKNVAMNKSDRNILFTLTNLESDKDLVKFRMSANELLAGAERKIEILGDAGKSFGLFLCTDSLKEGSCFGKTVLSHVDISKRAANRANDQNSDFVLYFNNVILQSGMISTYTNQYSEVTDSSRLRTFLQSNFHLNDKDFKKVVKYSSKMRSTPPRITSKKLILVLPYNDPECTPQSL